MIVSLFGIVNTLVLTVFERTRELGMLRAIGMTRRQVRRMIRHESIVTALIGATLGIARRHLPRRARDAGALRPGNRVRRSVADASSCSSLVAIAAGVLAAIFPRGAHRGSTSSRHSSTSSDGLPAPVGLGDGHFSDRDGRCSPARARRRVPQPAAGRRPRPACPRGRDLARGGHRGDRCVPAAAARLSRRRSRSSSASLRS